MLLLEERANRVEVGQLLIKTIIAVLIARAASGLK
jgi:Flp pilus assembly pilin Flp